MAMRSMETLKEFERNVEYFVEVCSDYRADFCVFPEMFTVALLALEKRKLTPEESIAALSRHTPGFVELMSTLAVRYNINTGAMTFNGKPINDAAMDDLAAICRDMLAAKKR